MKARPYGAWGENHGPVLWWRFPVREPPFAGTPLDSDWPGYHTHWTPIEVPDAGEDEQYEGEWSADGRLTLSSAYYDDPSRVYMVLQLVTEGEGITERQIIGWTSMQRKLAAEWAVSAHLAASDNDDVVVPPKPDFMTKGDNDGDQQEHDDLPR